MAGKVNAHQVVDFALHEIGAFPDAGDGGDGRIVFGDAGLEPKPMVMRKRVKW